MRKKFENLYNDWQMSYRFNSILTDNIVFNDKFEKFLTYCKKHKEEAIDYLKECLENKPSRLYLVIEKLLIDENMYEEYREMFKSDNFTLENACNIWLNVLNNTTEIDYYIEYKEYQKYIQDNYIAWDPRLENDPNISFQEFKQRLRNKLKSKT